MLVFDVRRTVAALAAVASVAATPEMNRQANGAPVRGPWRHSGRAAQHIA